MSGPVFVLMLLGMLVVYAVFDGYLGKKLLKGKIYDQDKIIQKKDKIIFNLESMVGIFEDALRLQDEIIKDQEKVLKKYRGD